jgi:ABC-type branched-subunit amino acid transport system permease subunit
LIKESPAAFFIADLLSSIFSWGAAVGNTKRMKYFRTLAPLFAVILFSLVFPFLTGDSSANSMAVEILLLIGVAGAWNIFSGYTGYISLGHATYYGLGAYTMALASQDWHIPGAYGLFLLLPLAGLVAGIFAIPLGWIALHTRRYTFMVITIAILFIFQLLAFNLRGITSGSTGIFLPLPTWSSDLYNTPFYYMALAVLILITGVSWRIRHSKYGLVLLAIRDDEDRVRGLGLHTGRYKLSIYMLSAAFTGMVGALAIYFVGFITPTAAFDQTLDITVVTVTFFGGIGSVAGPIVGGLVLEPLQTYLVQQYGAAAANINQILFGCFLLVIILLLPRGVVPSLQKLWQVWRASHNKTNTMETVLSAFKDPLDVSSENIYSIVPQGMLAQGVPVEQLPSQVLRTVPKRHTRQTEPLPGTMQLTSKVRSQRLVPLMGTDVLPVSSGKITVPSPVSWRCPDCKIPLLLNSDTCYCRRCGFTRLLADGKQSIS